MEFSSLLDVEQTFDSEEKSIEHLAKLRWPNGPVCPFCGRRERIIYVTTHRIWRCGDCKKRFSVRIGTVFEGSRLPLKKWFAAMWLIGSNKKDADANQIARDIGVTQKTASAMLGRLQKAMPMLEGSEDPFSVVRPEIPQTFIKLVKGDCLVKLPDIERESVHLIVTDPPYYLDGLNSDWRKGTKGTPRGTGSVGGLPPGMKFDPRHGRELQAFMERVGGEMLNTLMPGAFAVVFSQPRLVHRLAVGLEDAGFEIRDLYIWNYTRRAQFKAFSMNHFIDKMDKSSIEKKQLKRQLRGRKTAQLRPQFESMVLAQKPRQGTLVENWIRYETGLIDASATIDGKAPSTVMTVEKPQKEEGNDHLTVKPVLLIEHLINLFSAPGQVVLDPFLGSGTTAVAALRTSRACIGIEINDDYVTIAKRRLKEANR